MHMIIAFFLFYKYSITFISPDFSDPTHNLPSLYTLSLLGLVHNHQHISGIFRSDLVCVDSRC